MEEAARADRILVMNDGELVMDGTPQEIFTQVERLRGLGLEVPQTVELLTDLRAAGIDVPTDALTADACVEAIMARLGEVTP